MPVNKSKNIENRLVVGVLLFSLLVSLLVTIIEGYRTYHNNLSQIKTTIQQIETNFIPHIAKDAWFLDHDRLDFQLNNILRLRDIEQLELKTDSGKVMSVGSASSAQTIKHEFPLTFSQSGKDVSIGHLTMHLGRDAANQDLFEQIIFSLVGNTFIIFSIACFVLIFFKKTVTVHLMNIADNVSKLSPLEGAYTPLSLDRQKPERSNVDELDQVVEAINNLQLRLRHSNDQLRESEERFQKMFRTHHANMLLIDQSNGDILDANDAACKFYGYEIEELKKLSIFAINTLPKEKVLALMREAAVRKQNYFEFTHRLATGEERDVESYSTLINIDQQSVLFAIIHDITERNKLMAEQTRSAQLAALGTITAGVAHEINNPVQGIMNYATLIANAPQRTENVVEFSRRIIHDSERIANLTKDLLSCSKSADNIEKNCDINEIVTSSVTPVETKFRQAGVTINTELSSQLPLIAAYPQSLQQVFINLLDNACDALLEKKELRSEQRKVRMTTATLEANGQAFICISCHDEGIGMSEDARQRAKEAFFSTKPRDKGTGLGLSIVNDIVAKHKGRLEIDSQEGKYTRISILLPVN